MDPKRSQRPSTPSAPSIIGLRPRRDSWSSLGSRSSANRHNFAQVLDQIHNSASRSESLTTFSDFAPLPVSSSADGRGSGGDIVQAGLSGLYTRIKASVGAIQNAGKSSTVASSDSTSDVRSKTNELKPTSSALRTTSPVILPPEVTPETISSSGFQLAARVGTNSGNANTNPATPSLRRTPYAAATPAGPKPDSVRVTAVKYVQLAATAPSDVDLLNKINPSGSVSGHSSPRALPAQKHSLGPAQGHGLLGKESSSDKPVKNHDVGLSVDSRDTPTDADIAADQVVNLLNTVSEEDNGNLNIVDTSEKNTASTHSSAAGPYQQSHAGVQSPSAQAVAAITPVTPRQRSVVQQSISNPSGTRRSQSPSLDINDPSYRIEAIASQQLVFSSAPDPLKSVPKGKPSVIHNTQSPAPALEVKRSLLSKDFWMKDENAKECFHCGKAFSTFRRKHHCRLCGQIFDSGCTSLVPGKPFGQSTSVRICKVCDKMMKGDSDDSSDLSEDGDTYHMSSSRPISSISRNQYFEDTGSMGAAHFADNTSWDGHITEAATPTIGTSVSRMTGNSGYRSTVKGIKDQSLLARPSSSKSLKSLRGRSRSSIHKRYNSRQQYLRRMNLEHDDRAPFQSTVADDETGPDLPVFQQHSIIDPDLAPFLSDDASSGEEQASIFATMNDHDEAASTEHGGSSVNVLSIGRTKSQHKAVDNSRGEVQKFRRDFDNFNLTSSRTGRLSQVSRKRNISFINFGHVRPSPRVSKSASILQAGTRFGDLADQDHPSPSKESPPKGSDDTSQVITSSAMRGADAPAIELNSASLNHVRKLLTQLLEDARVPHVSRWQEALVPILLQCTDDVDPDVQGGDDTDIRSYIKTKKIPGGRPGDTAYVSGVVFSKNVALKSMPRHVVEPRIVILTFPIEYARHGHHFMSLEPVIAQEREYLRNLVNRILALHPQVLLVQGNVAGHALEYLDEAKVAVAYNVKPAVLNAVSRCTQTKKISSINQLSRENFRLSKCSSFDVKTYVNRGVKKSFIFLSGCYKELGCTLVLRGAETEVLRTVKRITEFMCYVVYNLKLETCLMRDEFVLMPLCADGGSMSPTKHLNDRAERITKPNLAPAEDTMYSSNNQFDVRLRHQGEPLIHNHTADAAADARKELDATDSTSCSEEADPMSKGHVQRPADLPVPSFYSSMVEKHQTKILSASPFVKFMQPYVLMKAREQESLILHLKRLLDLDAQEDHLQDKDAPSQDFSLVQPEMIYGKVTSVSKQIRDILHALHKAEYDDAMHKYVTRKKQWEYLIANNPTLFDPVAHQSIVVLFGIVCTPTSVPCNGPDIRVLEYYTNEHSAGDPQACDSTLGQYIEDACSSAYSVCNSNGCDKKMLDHHRQYVHGDGQVSIFVGKYPSRIRGLQNTILMWSCCRICGKETQVLPMSDNTWKYSLGKYLELSFWNMELHARADICPHDIHRDHVRFFGFIDLAVRVQYDTISLFELRVPRTIVTWKIDSDLRLKNDQFSRIEERMNRYMASVKARIQSIQVTSVLPENSQACKAELDNLTMRANDEHKFLIDKLQAKYMASRYYECIPLNRAIRAMQEKVAEWDTIFSDFERNFFPSERDIRRLAMGQFKKLFIDRDEPISSFSSEEGVDIAPDEVEEVKLEGKEFDSTSSGTPAEPTGDPVQAGDDLPEPASERQIGSPVMTGNDIENDDPSRDLSPHSEGGDHDTFAPKDSLQGFEREAIRSLDPAMPSTSQGDREDGGNAVVPLPEVNTTTVPDINEVVEAETPTEVVAIDPILTQKIEAMRAAAFIRERPGHGFESRIPRPYNTVSRSFGTTIVPPLSRVNTQPILSPKSAANGIDDSSTPSNPPPLGLSAELHTPLKPTLSEPSGVSSQQLLDSSHFPSHRPTKPSSQSLIPRFVQTHGQDTKVSLLAKHFEQLSREFEKERLRERRLRAERTRQSRAYPVALSKPVVEVYRDAQEIEHGKGEPDDCTDTIKSLPLHTETPEETGSQSRPESTLDSVSERLEAMAQPDKPAEPMDLSNEIQASAELSTEPASEAEGDGSDTERPSSNETPAPEIKDKENLDRTQPQLDQNLDLSKHQKVSFMQMLSRFWSERSSSGWSPLEYPLVPTDHIFIDSDIIVREDEPSSLIAFVLTSQSYQAELQKIQKLGGASRGMNEKGNRQSHEHTEHTPQHFLTRGVDRHVDVAFQEGTAKMSCKVWYAGSFDALRKECGVSDRIVETLSRCLKWDSKGGKTKSLFLKTLDERFILKSLSATEQAQFKDLAFDYFKYMAEVLFDGIPSAIAKIIGFYDVKITNSSTGVEFERSLLVMENLFYDCKPAQKFDLKGSMRNRKIQSTGGQDEVLLDENMVEFIYEKPIFVRQHSKSLFTKCIRNDTAFLAARNVMDYSLMLGFDEEKKELVVGLIDYIRTYTWDKKLESWIKDRGKNKPTITSPIDYRNRFRGSMSNYVLVAPSCWHQFRRGAAMPVATAETSSVRSGERTSAALQKGAERKGSREEDIVKEEQKDGSKNDGTD